VPAHQRFDAVRVAVDGILEEGFPQRALPEDPDQYERIFSEWKIWAREEQLTPAGRWSTWLIQAGRGWGKTRTGAEWTKEQILEMPGSRGFIAARTIKDARNTCVEGESGLLAVMPPGIEYRWNRSIGELRFAVGDGVDVKLFTSEKPDQARGPQHHWGWCDEFAAWLKECSLFDQLMLGLRLPFPGKQTRCCITTTPRPTKAVRALLKRKGLVITKGRTHDNLDNLNEEYRNLIDSYEGTRLGRQELEGELLTDTPGALWRRELFERPGFRRNLVKENGELDRALFDYIVIGIDPAVTTGDDSDLTGIVAAGRYANPSTTKELLEWALKRAITGERYGKLDRYCILADVSGRLAPSEWSQAAVELYRTWNADLIVAETNRGGDMVEAVIRAVDEMVPFKKVTATRGKKTRAEPIATLYEQGRVDHAGVFDSLEDEMCTFNPNDIREGGQLIKPDSPDRLDALVWAMTELGDAQKLWIT
jgi:phage terminase large subunit-like protein